MTTATNRWLDRLAAHDKAHGGTGTDYKVAQLIGIDPQLMSKYRHRDTQMGDAPAMKLAEALGLHPMIVIADIRAEQPRDLRARRMWEQLEKAARGGKLAQLVGAVILAAPFGPSLSESALQLCILCSMAPASNDDDFRAPARLPSFKRGRIVHLSELTVTPERARAA